ncbi:MAG: hypothetical protein WBZ29_17765, partial [Methanocella sp.]
MPADAAWATPGFSGLMKNLINEADACRSNDKCNKPYKWSLDIAIFHHLYLKIPFFIRRVLRR